MSLPAWIPTAAWRQRLDAACASLAERGFAAGPQTGLVLGSGLGDFVDTLEVRAVADFADIPGFSGPRVKAHAGRIVQGERDGQPLLVLQGRPHAYEGLGFAEVVLPVAVMAQLGCGILVLTNAAGGLSPRMRAGELAVLTDLIDLHQAEVARGILTPDPRVPAHYFARARRAGAIFDPGLARVMIRAAAGAGLGVHRSTYASVFGPHYEEPATIGLLRRMGAGVVGMSTGPEAAYLHAIGVRVAGLSCITNVAVEHGAVEVSHDEVVQVGGESGGSFATLLLAALPELIRGDS